MTKNFKVDFPVFQNNPRLVYLDSAVTSQKPQAVIDAVSQFYVQSNATVHRGLYDLSDNATSMYESVRAKVASFIGVKDASEIIFTSGTTASINLVAYGWAKKFLKSKDIVVVSEMEHHSNLVPWQRLRDELDVQLVFLKIDPSGRLDYQSTRIDFSRVKLIALAHGSNVLGTINPIVDIVRCFKDKGANPKVLLDAAQTVPHLPINVDDLGVDFLAFSSHKMLGPSGVGVLWAKKDLLSCMDTLIVGSHMIDRVTIQDYTLAEMPDRFEPGTPNIEGVIGLGTAIDYLESIGMDKLSVHEKELTSYALDSIKSCGVRLFGPSDMAERLGVLSFMVNDIHPHDVAEVLNRYGVAVRAGHHCAQPLMDVLGVPGTVRASLYLYNTKADIDALVVGISEVKKVFKR